MGHSRGFPPWARPLRNLCSGRASAASFLGINHASLRRQTPAHIWPLHPYRARSWDRSLPAVLCGIHINASPDPRSLKYRSVWKAFSRKCPIVKSYSRQAASFKAVQHSRLSERFFLYIYFFYLLSAKAVRQEPFQTFPSERKAISVRWYPPVQACIHHGPLRATWGFF